MASAGWVDWLFEATPNSREERAIQTALSCWATAQVYLEEWAIFGIIGASKPGIDTLGGNGMRVHHSVIVVACFSHLWLAICRDSSAGDLRPYPLPPAARAGI